MYFPDSLKYGEDKDMDKAVNSLNITSGKLSLNFFKIFLTNLILQNKTGIKLAGLYDLRLISALMYSDNLGKFKVDPPLPYGGECYLLYMIYPMFLTLINL